MNKNATRRQLVLGLVGTVAGLAVGACKKEPRCKHCGMKIDPASAWRADLVAADGTVTSFDTPRCALTSWRTGKSTAETLKVQEYYDRAWRSAAELRFVLGGDVVGPMGPDLVPVDPSHVAKFIQDHGADRALKLEEVTAAALADLK